MWNVDPAGEAVEALGALVPAAWSSPDDRTRYSVAGVSVPMDAALVDVYSALGYPDQYLYICQLPNRTSR
jgi:hypothetical protein